MKRAALLLSCILLLPACPKSTSDTTDASPPAIADAAGVTFRYDCSGLAPIEEAGACPAGAAEPRATDALVHLSEKLTELVGMHQPPPPEWWTPARAALDAAVAATGDPKALPLAERVTIQNAALHLAVSARAGRVRDRLPIDAMKLVDRLAFSPEEQAQVAAIAVDLSSWLGPPAERTERTKLVPLFHEQVVHHTRVVRLVKTARLRANFSELVAVGTDGRPFVTPVVASMEVRRGFGPNAPACVALQSPERLRCGLFDGIIDARDLAKLPQSYFLRRDERGDLRCNDCHGLSGNEPIIGVVDLAPTATMNELAKHRRATLDRLRPLLEPLRPLSPPP